jgi:predicted nucleic acid-binding protein
LNWLLDTNVISEGLRPRPSRDVLRWVAERPAEQLAVSEVTLAEMRNGALEALDAGRRQVVENWLMKIAEMFQDRVLPLNVDILSDWLALARRLRARGKPQSAPDLLIASTARIYGLTVVTRNVRDFADTGVVVYDPWHDQTHHMDQP